MTANRRVALVVALWAVLGWAAIDGPVLWNLRNMMAEWMGLGPYWSFWVWRVLAVLLGVLFALLVQRVWFLAAPATVLIDLPLLMYDGPGNLAGLVLSLRREWIALVALGSLIGWGVARWSTGRPNKGMKLTRRKR